MLENYYQGGCLCGACRYVISGGKPQGMYLCHCRRCRKETGTIHGANVFFNDVQLDWEKGIDDVRYFKLENTRHARAFCQFCGSPLPCYEGDGGIVLPAGSLDHDTFLEPTAHIFYADRSLWEDKLANLNRFDELPKID